MYSGKEAAAGGCLMVIVWLGAILLNLALLVGAVWVVVKVLQFMGVI